MDFRKWVFLIFIVLAVFLIVLSVRQTRDITGTVSKIEQAVFSVLEKHGITRSNIVFREEKEWQKKKLLGKTVNCVLKKEGAFLKKGFPDDLKKTLKRFKGVRVDRILSRTDGHLDKIIFDIAFKREIVVSVKLESVTGKSKEKKSMLVTVLPRKVPRIAIVLDDFGYTKKNLETLSELAVPLTLAVLPNTKYSKEVCLFAAENNLEIILHLPMEPENASQYLEKNTITIDMNDTMVHNIIAANFDSVVFAKGVSNHMGSKATKDIRVMDILFNDLKKKNMYFFDSLTTEESVGRSLAEKIGLPYLRRDIFIDNEADKDYINEQIKKLEEIALERGSAVAIGHDRDTTIDVLREAVPRIKEKGIRFVRLSEMLMSGKSK